MSTLGRNIAFPIYNGDGTSFHNLVIKKSTSDSIVMSLGDKVTGDVYYKDNTLECNMDEYILVDGVKYSIVNPPTLVREGLKSENGDLKGMTKYSFEFYHPMYMLGNMAFSDVAVTNSEAMFKSHDRTFSWIGNLTDYVAKLNKNLQDTQFIVSISSSIDADSRKVLSDVLSFTNNTIADALKTAYDTWHFPFVVDAIKSGEQYYNQGKRFLIQFGNPTREILDSNNQPFVFHFGKGVGLKNNSRTPRNNKIVTRVAGYGSEQNIPYGYPQIPWTGDPSATQTADGYPIYEGIVGGVVTKLVKHPFTRTHLMPSVYAESVRKKVDSAASDYDNTTPLVDYYDAPSTYPNPINLAAPKLDIVGIETIKPELGGMAILGVTPLNNDLTPASGWDDTMDDDGNYTQSYFKITLPQLDFDIYACASITEEMKINMRSGACIGCTFDAQVDWDDYKKNFFDAQGNFLPNGEQRDLTKYPKSNDGSIDLIVKKDLNTYGTLMPNVYQKPSQGDKFVILGISMPSTYITNAEERLDAALMTHMLDNNVYYYDYPLKFDEDFFYNHTDILSQVRPNSVLRFTFGGVEKSLYIKQITIKYGEGVLPKYDITLTDNIEVVLNQIGLVADDVSRLAMAMMQMNKRTNINITNTESLQRYVDYTIMPNLESIQKQIDGSQVTYFGNENPFDASQPYSDGKYVVDPTKFPASEWDDDYSEHDGDMFYNRDSGKGYEFTIIDNSTSPVVYGWQLIQDEDIIQALTNAQNAQDTADGKRRVFICDASHHTPNPPYDVGDLWVNVKYPYATGATYDDEILKCVVAKTEDQTFDISDWSLANGYTAALRNFINGTYADNLQEIQTQIDGKAETWYQNTDPSTAWTTTSLKNQHKGDIWHNSSTSTINGVKAGQDAIWNGTAWVVDETVPQAVYDEIDGKCAIYVTWGAWGNDLQEKDLFIPAADTTQGGTTYKANKVYRCVDKDTPTFQEIAYTDDTQYNGFITKLIGSSGQTKDAAENAIAAIKHALSDGNTYNEGGLILSNLISLGTGNPLSGTFTPWAGISGIYKTSETGTGYKGHGIAAWFGGGMIDKEVSAVSNAAKSLFRFDGSGYVASGNLKWDANGNVTIQGYSINATTLQVGGSNVATQAMLDSFVSKAFFNRLFTAYDANGNAIVPNDTTTAINNLKIMVGAWTEQYMSALGLNSEGGGGGTGSVNSIKIASNTYLDPDEDGIIDMSSYATNWNDAYNKRHTHSNKSVLDGITSTKVSHWDAVYGVVPSAAYESGNQLADKNFVNSSISTSTATFRGTNTTATTESAFLTWANGLTHDLNDYVFWSMKDSAGNTIYKRYKYDGSQWVFEYDLNNSSFTSDQWNAINSGITSTHVSKLNGIASGAQVNVIETVKVNGSALTVTSKAVDITAVPLTIITGADDLKAIEGLSGTSGFLKKTAANTWALDTTVVLSTRKVSTGNGLQGGGDLSADRTISILLPSNSGLSVASTGLKLDIVNNLTTASDYRAISATQAKKIWDLLNQMFTLEGSGTTASPYVIKANYGLYTNQFLSALGQNSEGGSGGGMGEDEMWAALQANTGTYENAKINWNHIPLATTSTAGAIKVGSTLAISNGILNQATIPNFIADVYTKVTVDTYGRVTQGGDLIEGDIPTLSISKISGLSTALGNVYTKTESDGKYITAIGTNGNYLTYTKNGNSNSITVPYATISSKIKTQILVNDSDLNSALYSGFYRVNGKATIHAGWYDDQNTAGFDLQIEDTKTSNLKFRARIGGNGMGDWKEVLDSANSYVSSGKGYINGTEITAVTTASKLGSTTVGGANTPIYLNNGTPTQVTSINGAIVGGYIGYSEYGYLVTHPEATKGLIIPYIYNDLAFLTSQGGSCTIYSTTETDLTKDTLTVKTDWSSTSTIGNLFDGSPLYWSGGNNNATAMNADGLIIDITLPNLKTWGNKFYIDFGNNTFGYSNIDILLKNSANDTNYVSKVSGGVINDKAQYYANISHSSTPQGGGSSVSGFDRMRIHLYGRTHTSGVRIAQIGLIQYNSLGQRYTSMSRGYDDYVYRSITPNTTSTYSLGTSARRWKNIYGAALNLSGGLSATTGSFSSSVSVGSVLRVSSDTTIGGNLTLSTNNKSIKLTDSNGTARTVINFNSSNTFQLGCTPDVDWNTILRGYRIYFQYGVNHTSGMILNSAGDLAIGVDSPSYRLHVGGTLGVTEAATLLSSLSVASGITLTTTKKIYFGDSSHYLELDANGYFHFSHGLYSDSFVSALGANDQGGGGSTFDEEQMWQALGSDPVSAKKIDNSHLNIAAWAKAANKPSYAWSEITNKPSWIGASKPTYTFSEIGSTPTTLAGYGITDAWSTSVSRTKNTVLAAPSNANGTASFRALVAADIPDLSSTYATALRATTLEGYFTDGVAKNAAKLSNYSLENFMVFTNATNYVNASFTNTAYSAKAHQTYIEFWDGGTDCGWFNFKLGGLDCTGAVTLSSTLSVTGAINASSYITIANDIAYRAKDSNGANVDILRLASSNNLFVGQGTSPQGYSTYINGNNVYLRYGTSRTTGLTLNSSGVVSISGATNIAGLLSANGNVKTTKLYLYKPNSDDTNAVYLTYDSTNSGVHLVGAGLYSDSYVSALGANSQGGGGGDASLNAVWGSLTTYNDEFKDEVIDIHHIPNLEWAKITKRPTTLSGYGILDAYTKTQIDTTLGSYATQSWVNQQGFVKSSGVTSVATGSGLTGGTITSTGTISIVSGFSSWANALGTWGTLKTANGYTSALQWKSSDGGEMSFAYKGGQISAQLDGYFYQNEGAYRVVDTSDLAAGKSWGMSITGSAAKLGTSTVGSTTMPIYLSNGTPTQITSFPEAYLSWGGKNIASGYGVIDAAMISELGANRMAFMPAAKVIVEYSRDNGATWLDYEATDTQKLGLTGASANFVIGKSSNGNCTADCKLRITFITGGSLYTTLNKFALFVSTNGSIGSKCTIQARTQQNYEDNVDTWVNFATDVAIGGWSGWNIINTSGLTTYGNTKASQYGQFRFIFGNDRFDGAGTTRTGLSIQKIRGFGGQGWGTPSYMAASGHIYRTDELQNAFFPADIRPKDSNTYYLGYSNARWKGLFSGSGDFSGNVVVGGYLDMTGVIAAHSSIYIDNNRFIYWKDSGGTLRRALDLDSSNNLRFGYGTATEHYNSYIEGYNLYLCYGSAHTNGLTLDSSGNITTVGHTYMANGKAIYFKDSGGTVRNSIEFAANNIFSLGYGAGAAGYDTFLYGNRIYLRYGTSGTVGLTLGSSGAVIIPSTGSLKIGDATLSWDSTNQMLKFDKGIYSTGAVSALGSNDEGGGSSDFSEELMWAALQSNTGTYANAKIDSNHIPDTSSLYGYLKSSSLSGYVNAVSTSGDGNAVTSVTKSGNTITFTKGSTFLTSHQTINALTLKADGTAVTTYTPNSAAASLNFVAGSNISLTRGTNQITIANTYSYTLPLAASGTRGGVQIGYSESNSGTSTTRNYAVKLSSEKMYVNVPWENTTYESKTAASGGTAVSLVTTGEKYTWNNKQDAISDLSTIRSNASNGNTAYGYFTSGAAKNAVTTLDNTNTLYLVGVVSSATTTLKHNSSVTIKGGALTTTGNVSVGGALSVASGITLTTTKKIYFGDTSHYLELDSTGFHFVGAGVYSDSFVSALGANSSGGSSTFDEDSMWAALGTTSSAKVIASSHIPNLSASKITSGTLAAARIPSLAASKITSGTFDTARIPNLSADKITSGTFAAARIPVATASAVGGIKVGTTLAISDGVLNQKSGIATAGTYRSVTVDTYGRVTAGTNPTTLSGYGITNAYTKTEVDNALSGYLPLSGGQMTGTLTWKNSTALSGVTSTSYVLCIDGFADGGATHYISTSNLTVGNATNATNATSATTASKLSTVSKTAWGQTYWTSGGVPTNISGALSDVTNITMSGNIYLNNNQYIYTKDSGGTNRPMFYMTTANNLYIGYGSSAASGSTYVAGTSVELRYGSSRTTGLTLDGGDVTVKGKVCVGTGGADSYLASDAADNIYLRNSSGAVLVCDGKVIRRSTSVSDVTLGSSSYPWGGLYSTTGSFSSTLTVSGTSTFNAYTYRANTVYDCWYDSNGDAVAIHSLSSANNYWVGYGLCPKGYQLRIGGGSIQFYSGTDRTSRMFIASEGNVGIGTTSPGYKLGVVGTLGVTGKATFGEGLNITGSSDSYSQGIRIHDVGSTSSIWMRCANATGNDEGMIGITGNTNGLLFRLPSTSTGTSYNTYMFIAYGGNVGIGNTSPSQKLHVTGNILASGEITASSDERKKNILSNTKFNVRDIASARSIIYEWNDGRDKDNDKKIHGGSIAQDWLGKADSFLMQDEDGFYSINYGALALCSAITIAREVLKHEDRITKLERENAYLKNRVNELERRIA